MTTVMKAGIDGFMNRLALVFAVNVFSMSFWMYGLTAFVFNGKKQPLDVIIAVTITS